MLILVVGLRVYEVQQVDRHARLRPGRAALVINKFGDPLPADLIAVPANENHYKGVQEQPRSPGRYFLNPLEYKPQLIPLTVIPAGDPQSWRFDRDGHLEDPNTQPMVGLVACQQGKTPPPGVEVVDPGSRASKKADARHIQDQPDLFGYARPPVAVRRIRRRHHALTGDRGPTTSVTLTGNWRKPTGLSTQPDAPRPIKPPAA